jgi:hypothetical protein
MNSATMPKEGFYNLTGITQGGFMRTLKRAYQDQRLASWLGYQQNADYIEKHTGIKLPLTRQQTEIAKIPGRWAA